jgi:DNA-binding winged helix-turn-helix (wHTH) protein
LTPGLNKAVNHLREALGDSAEHPQFIETLPRKGYRFVGQLAEESRCPNLSPSPFSPRAQNIVFGSQPQSFWRWS